MMKKEEATAMESSRSPNGALFYSDSQPGGAAGYSNQCSVFDDGMMGNGAAGAGEIGFLEMLGVHQEFQIPIGSSSYMFEDMFQREVLLLPSIDHHQVAGGGDGNNNNAPGTPNSSSISSASNNEGVVVESEQEKVEEDEVEEEEEDQQGSGKSDKKQLKAKKANLKKKQRQPRFAFMTKSEVDHLEDGYRWRKYGQKAVKNSPFPRSYYRCTTTSCGVKKRVERSCTDKSVVVTTYEGQHTHPSPLTPRGLSSSIFRDSAAFAATMPTLMQMNNLHYSRYQQQLTASSYFASSSSPLNYNNSYPINSLATPNYTSFTAPASITRNHANVSNPTNQGFIKDHGLLQDLIPSLAPKVE